MLSRLGLELAYDPIKHYRVNEARSALEATLLEVEVLWGTELLTKVRKLYNWDGELYAAIMEHLDAVITDAPGGERTPADRTRTREIMHSRSDKEKDKFLNGLQQAIEEVEKAVKPHLKRFI